MEFLLLGPLEVHAGDGAIPIGGPKQRTVLALLVLEANRPVSVDRFVEALWGSEPPATARNTVQTYIRLLRRALGAERIEHRAGGYVLRAAPDEVDALRFKAGVEEARRLRSSDPVRACAALHEAIGLWRGPALDDLADQAALQPEIVRLEESRLAATEDRITADLAHGRHRELVPELEILVGRHPLREQLWEQLMVALYRSGRQGDALAAYRRARSILVEDLGIDPSPELRRVEEQVLRQDPALDLGGEPLRGYRLIERVGEGPFTVVHRAYQPQVGREAAIKTFDRDLANDPEFVRRFEPEARLVARLDHAHIVPLSDFWRDPDGAYLVMRFLRGGNLRDRVHRTGPLDVSVALHVLEHVSRALAAAHRQGIVHGDVRPENVLFDDDGDAYLADFAIATECIRSRARRSGARGVFAYAPPEQIEGTATAPTADVYSLGILMHEALVGRHPFAGGSLASLVNRHLHAPLPSVMEDRPDLPPSLDGVLARATAKDPALRYGDVLSFATAFERAFAEPGTLPSPVTAPELTNPYKGLRAFDESDAADFFGRERMIERLAARFAEDVDGSRLLVVVGPSGSGKSSLVRAGLVPALRRDALPGSAGWFTTELVPGPRPFGALEAALLRVAIAPADLGELVGRDAGGLLRAARRILPADGRSELVLVVDQLEELYTLATSDVDRTAFLAAIAEATTDPESHVRVILMLRADFYDRPLLDARFGPLLGRRTEAVTPLTPDELERAITRPAERVGVSLEPSLLAEIVADVADQPGALPLLQYTLTELFERRRDRTMTLDAYREIGELSGALAGRAEELFLRLDAEGREACRQVFLRLVALGEGGEDTRRRVQRSELSALEVDRRSVELVIDAFGRHRLLSFDRDEGTRGPTIELAHEALIGGWQRLHGWIDEGREDVRTHRRLANTAEEWTASGGDPSFLLTGARLESLAAWVSQTHLALDREEREFVRTSLVRRDADLEAERARLEHERSLERRSIRRMRALIAVLAAAALLASGLTTVAVSRGREAERRRVEAVLTEQREMVGRLTAASVASLEADPAMSLRLALHAVEVTAALHEPIPAATVEALHWGLQEAGVQYPVADGPVAMVAGPLGTRGVYDVPLSQLLELARAHAAPSLAPEACEQHFGSTTCPSLPGTFADDLLAEPVRAVAPASPDRPLAGTEVAVFNVTDERTGFRAEIDRFTATTGIRVRLIAVSNVANWVGQSVAAGDPPELAFFPQPGGIVHLGRKGLLMDLGVYLDVERLRADQSPYLVSLGTVAPDGSWPSPAGRTYGAFVGLNVKSLIWYPVPEFRDAGYAIPQTWDELLALSDRLEGDGRDPWCLGFLSSDSNGWPGTDWIENLVLLGDGPVVYDRWTLHEIPFDSAPVHHAFERFGRILFEDGSIHLGREGALETWVGTAQLPMIQRDPPGCWLYQSPSFTASFLPNGSVDVETDAFPFPPPSERFRGAVLGGGSMVAALADRPEVRELVRFLVSPEYGVEWARLGLPFLSPNRRFDPDSYTPWWGRQARLLDAALADDVFRFDGSDLMPPRIGQGLFWDAMMTYLAEGPDNLDRLLAALDAAWPAE